MVNINLAEDQLKQILKGVYEPQAFKSEDLHTHTKKAIIISGPTCVGKTALSLRIAEKISGEVIIADSMQIYQGMDIGTAKATVQERNRVPHHLIDIREITDHFTAVDFFHEAQLCCESILARGKVPIFVGGSGFYIHILLYGPPVGPPSQLELRKNLENEIEKFSPDAMYDRLQKIDPEYAKTITKHDKVKIVRALEIITITQDKVSHLKWNEHHAPINYDYRCWFLYRSREILYSRIEERCDAMLKEGLLEETARLKELGLTQNQSASRAIGYRQCLEFLASKQTEDDRENMISKFKKATRNYAKRQFTWFRKEPEFHWLDLDVHDREIAADIIIQDYLQQDMF